MKPVDLRGQRFGRLIVLSRTKISSKTAWVCHCDCGTEVRIRHSCLGRSTNSCGCLRKTVARARVRKTPGHSAKTSIWNYYQRNARTRGIAWELPRAEFETLIAKPCFYCGRLNATTTTRYGDTIQHNGVDRIDNNAGYITENSVPCCKTCNQAKNTLSIDEFRSWAESFSARVGGW